MRIGVDGYNLALPDGTGIATYGFTLVQMLKAMGASVDGVFGLDVGGVKAVREARFYERFTQPEPGSFVGRPILRTVDSLGLVFGASAVEVPAGGVETQGFADRMPAFDRLFSSANIFSRAHAYFRATGRLATLRMADPPDIMHWTYPLPLRLAGAKNIYTIHDVVPLRLPFASLGGKARYRALVQACIAESELICTVSESSRADIVSIFRADKETVFNTYQASTLSDAEINENSLTSAQQIENIFGLTHRGYFLFFGAIEPKKNVGRLIEAYLSLGTKTPLVIVAGRSWQSEAELRLLADNSASSDQGAGRLDGRIIRMDYQPRRLLMRLVRGARSVVFPSLFEGFGLPVHEAMLLGTPVLATTEGAVPEVAGDAALLVNPYDVGAIASALRRLDDDEALRAELSLRGPIQAGLFSPERYQARLNVMYRRLAEAS